MNRTQKEEMELQENELVLQGLMLTNMNYCEPASISYTAIFNQLFALAQKHRRDNERKDRAA